MSDDKTVEVGIGFKATEKSGLDLIKQTADSLDRARNSIDSANKAGGLKKVIAAGQLQEVNQLTEAAGKTAQEINDLLISMEGLAETDPGFVEKTKQVQALTEQLAALNVEAAKVPARLGESADNVTAPKGVEGKQAARELIGGVGGIASSVSPQAGQAAQVLQQLLQVGDGIKKLSSVLIDTPGIIGNVATAGATLAAPMGAMAAGLGAVLAVALPLVLAVAGLAAIVSHFNDKAKEGEEAGQKFIDGLDNQVKVDREIAAYLKSGDLEGAKKRLKDLKDTQEDANAELTYLYQKKADIDKQYADAQKNVNLDQLASLGSEGGKVKDQIDKVYKEQFLPAKQAVDEFGKSMDGITAAAGDKTTLDAQIKAIQDRATIETQLSDIIKQGNSGAIKDRREAIQTELDNTESSVDALKKLGDTSDDTTAAIDQANKHATDLRTELELYSPAAEAAAKAQADLNTATQDQLAAMVQEIQTRQQVAGFIKSASTSQLDDRLDSLNTEKAAILSQLDGIKELAKTNKDAEQKAKDYENRLKSINNEYDQLSAARPDVRAAEVQKAQDDIIVAETDTDRKIADIRTSGLAKIAEIESQASDARAAALAKENKAIGDANAAETKNTGDENAAYMKDSRAAWAKYYDDVAKSDAKNKKDRLRLIADTQASLLDAEKANDVTAFIAAENKGKDSLTQFDENAKDEAEARDAAFRQEREQAEQQHEDRLQAIKDQAQAQRDAAAVQYQADLDAAQKQHDDSIKSQQDQQEQLIAAEEAGLLQRVSAIQDTYKLEDSYVQDLFDKRKTRYGEDDKIVNDRLDLELQRHAEDLKIKANAEIAENTRATNTKATTERTAAEQTAGVIGQSFGGAVTVIQSGLANLIQSIQAQLQSVANNNLTGVGSSGSGSNSSGGSGGGGTATPTAFANEGIVTAAQGKTFAMLGENLTPGQIEAVVKFKPSEGLPKSLGGGGTTFNFSFGNVDLGGISRDEFMSGLHELAGEVMDGISGGRKPTE